ncbi:DEAD-box ATP-dependent RNA helicase CshA [Jejuia pallidilutea]|nr:DEAD-box ATP-dependent RNA helicase CshA [Jejuia pallidilutea]
MVIVSKSEVRKIKSIERIIKKQFEKKDIPNGMQICEVQLMSLAKKVHHTEVNHDIDTYLGDINALFEDTSKDELIKKFFSVEFSRFYNYYQKALDLNISVSNDDHKDSGNSVRYFINVGKKDGFDWMSLKDFLKEVLELGQDDVFKVEAKDTFSFFNTEKELQEKVLGFFTDFKHNGRFVNVEVSENRSRGGRRDSRKGGRRRDDRKSGSSFTSGKKGGRRSDQKSKSKRSKSGDFASSRPRRSRR